MIDYDWLWSWLVDYFPQTKNKEQKTANNKQQQQKYRAHGKSGIRKEKKGKNRVVERERTTCDVRKKKGEEPLAKGRST